MNVTELERDPELQQALIACYKYWKSEPMPPEERIICYTWVVGPYRRLFGGDFHQTKLYWLAKLGFLIQEYTVRGGGRRYYKIANPEFVKSLIEKWGAPVP